MNGTDRAATLLQSLRGRDVWVVGDLLLDEYILGRVHRVAAEAPVPVVLAERSALRPGGAANVACGVAALGARVRLCGVVGEDPAGDALLGLLTEAGVDVDAVVRVPGRRTTRKVRVQSHDQHVLRIDWDETAPLPADLEATLLERVFSGPEPGALALSDYAKGFFGDDLAQRFITAARARGIPTVVDPKRLDFGAYRGATVATPNRFELERAVRHPVGADERALELAARAVMASSEIETLIVTLGEQGMAVVEREATGWLQAARRDAVDVTGAGDTVVAVLATALAAGATVPLAAWLANAAAGVWVGRARGGAVTLGELAAAAAPSEGHKVLSRGELRERAAWWRLQGRSIVFTNGCFDLLHVGHVSLLRKAASFGDVLVVGLNSDASVTRLKGPSRPILPATDRAALLGALDAVSAVVTFEEDTPIELIRELHPDVLVKGADYRVDEIVGRAEVEADGGRVERVEIEAGHSTTALMQRIRGA